jgi:hypothetical protein
MSKCCFQPFQKRNVPAIHHESNIGPETFAVRFIELGRQLISKSVYQGRDELPQSASLRNGKFDLSTPHYGLQCQNGADFDEDHPFISFESSCFPSTNPEAPSRFPFRILGLI